MTDAEQSARVQPPEYAVREAIAASLNSPCQSKRGATVFRADGLIAFGYNWKPAPFRCDGSDACKSTCRTEAVHAEQMALLWAIGGRAGSDLLHVKTVDGKLVASGEPSCVECSKLILEAQIAGVWLFHESGWQRYLAADFHAQSLQSNQSRLVGEVAALRQERDESQQVLRGIDVLLDRRDALADVEGRVNKILVILNAAQHADPKGDSVRVITLTAKNQELEAQVAALSAQQTWQLDYDCLCSDPIAETMTIPRHCSLHRDGRPIRLRRAAVTKPWQPRKTAPIDGTVFRAFAPQFIDLDFNPWGSIEAVFDGERFIGAIWDGQHDIWRTEFVEFTHWMPLPAPPRGPKK